MGVIRYITHPNVAVEPEVEVTRWGLNDEGRRRAIAMLSQPWISTIGRIVSSDEAKAIETAEIVARHVGVNVEIRTDIGENDRTATGFVPPDEFERLADAFFERPDISVRGWERAVDAQARIVAGLGDVLGRKATSTETTVVVGHGAVGTLWYCHLTHQRIDRCHDQPGQGHYYAVEPRAHKVLHSWRAIDDIEGTQR